jgi:hypothetical protein
MSMKTDAQLKQDIIAELTWEPSVGLSKRTDGDIARSAQSILEWTSWLPRIRGENGWITLSGEVEWDYQPRRTQFARSSVLSVSAMTSR